MTRMPRDLWPDATLPLLRDPYRYIARRSRRMGTDAFRTRLLGQPAVCMTGPDAARFFYGTASLRRQGALPEHVAQVLFGRGGVQRLDGERHRQRKALLLDLLGDASVTRLEGATERALAAAGPELSAMERIDVFEESARILAVAVCDWAGVRLRETEVPGVTTMLTSLFLHAGSAGPQHRTGVKNRERAHIWARSEIRRARHDRAAGRSDPVATIAGWHDAGGTPLDTDSAATELLNVLRPTVAVAVFVTFAAMALHRNPAYRRAIVEDADFGHAFVQEVRRFYPFFPAVAARVAEDVGWAGEGIAAGSLLILDLHGTCRDPRAWEAAEAFRPERFLGRPADPWAMIPQGGGDASTTHRCPGEPTTVRLMELFLRRLATASYDVATPSARPNLRAIPALPKGGFVLRNFRTAPVRRPLSVAGGLERQTMRPGP